MKNIFRISAQVILFFAVQLTQAKTVFINNTSAIPVALQITINNRTHPLVVRKGELYQLGEAKEISTLNLSTYGQIKGMFAQTVSIDLDILKGDNDKIITIVPAIGLADTASGYAYQAADTLASAATSAAKGIISWWTGKDQTTAPEQGAGAGTSETPASPSSPTSPSQTSWGYEIKTITLKELQEILPLRKFKETFDTRSPRYFLGLPEEKDFNAADIQYAKDQKVNLVKRLGFSPAVEKKIINRINKAADIATQRFNETNQRKKEYYLFDWDITLNEDRIDYGKKITCRIIKGETIFPAFDNTSPLNKIEETRTQYLKAIVSLTWYLYSIAGDKKQAFSEGTFVIIKTPQLYNFLLNYVKLMNPSIKGTTKDLARMKADSPFAYSRLSSHFKLEQKQHRHYGIDIRFNPDNDVSRVLPAEKSHILFGKLNEHDFFIKLENYGIYSKENPQHAKEFGVSQLRKLTPLFQKHFQKDIADTLIEYIGTDDDPNYRKERIPAEFLRKCFRILGIMEESPTEQHTEGWHVVGDVKNLHKDTITSLMQDFAQKGMKMLVQMVQNPPEYLSDRQKEEFRNYLIELNNKERFKGYKVYDLMNLRYGREVIITDRLLKSKCGL